MVVLSGHKRDMDLCGLRSVEHVRDNILMQKSIWYEEKRMAGRPDL